MANLFCAAETIQGRKLFKGGNYSRKYGMLFLLLDLPNFGIPFCLKALHYYILLDVIECTYTQLICPNMAYMRIHKLQTLNVHV